MKFCDMHVHTSSSPDGICQRISSVKWLLKRESIPSVLLPMLICTPLTSATAVFLNRITLGSDTHKRKNAFFGLSSGRALIKSLGLNGYGIFHRGNYVTAPLLSG
ncbi:MAG: hypothetical protein KAH54_06180 [Candidatus Sabulitectum sp.]|nr:hypothetical protein [Candidatus Sabulitectum sp.]